MVTVFGLNPALVYETMYAPSFVIAGAAGVVVVVVFGATVVVAGFFVIVVETVVVADSPVTPPTTGASGATALFFPHIKPAPRAIITTTAPIMYFLFITLSLYSYTTHIATN
jgi:hypothetical protein